MFTYNPWLGCHKISPGCLNCYVFAYKDSKIDSNNIILNKNFEILVKKDRRGHYIITGGQDVIVCQKSDFLLEEADLYRPRLYEMIKERKDLHFILLTKRIERATKTLPDDWGNGYANVTFTVSCENQATFDERVPHLLALKACSKSLMLAPLLDEIDITKLVKKQTDIDYINCGGENFTGARPIYFNHIKKLSLDSLKLGIPFYFFDTGAFLVKDNKKYFIPLNKRYSQAFLANLSHN